MGRVDVLTFYKFFSRNGHPLQNVILCFTLVLCILLAPFIGHASEVDIEKDLQVGLEQSRAIILAVQNKLATHNAQPGTGLSLTSEISKLKSIADNINVSNLLLEERFKLREEKVKTLGSAASSRHQTMVAGYRKALVEYLNIIDGLPSSSQESVDSSQEKINKLKTLLDSLLPKKKRPIIGSLPYKHLNYPAQEPSTAPSITPAYKGGNKTVSPEDTKSTPEAPISKTIAALMQSMKWQPVAAYEYVKNNIETDWGYWGCQKGAEETLRQKSGNDCDQALLLASLLKSAGFPTQLVRANIQFFASDDKPIERVKNLTGIDDPNKIAEFFQKTGIPFKPIIQGGKIANFQIDHIYVESQIPMANYRGIVIDEHGKTWLGLDTSIKTKDHVYNNAKDIIQEPGFSSQLSGIRDDYLSAVQTQTPIEYLQSRINSALTTQNSQLTYSDFLLNRTLPPHHMKILPYGMQFVEKKIIGEYTEIPDELIHKVRFIASRQNTIGSIQDNLFDVTLPLYKLSNQQIAISYEPETVHDQEIIDSYGGLDNTPAYLIRLRPVLKISNERIVVAKDGLPMGSEYDLTVELIGASGVQSSEKITNTHIAGNLSMIGITAGKASLTPSPLAGEGGGEGAKDAERLLYEAAQHYIDRWNKAEDELASLLHLTLARPLPTVVTLGGVIDVTYLLDMPHGFTWKGVFVDADFRAIEAVHRTLDPDNRTRLFMQLSSLQGSILENRIFEDDFKVESISTAKLFQLVTRNSQPATDILTIDKTNIDAILPTLPFDDNIKEDITNSVNQNFTIRIPQSETTYHDWTGTGYVKEKTETGESGWMLSGMIAGGCPVDAVWLEQHYQNTLSSPFTGPVDSDPLSAAWVLKVAATDNQPGGIVGKTPPKPLAVFVADSKGKPVEGASVTFEIIAGGGDFGNVQCLDANGNPTGQSGPTCNAPTAHNGIAKAKVTLGKKTGDNPYYVKLNQTDPHYTQVGMNLVAAFVDSYSGVISLAQPFEEYAAPDAAGPDKKLVKVLGEGNSGFPNTPAGTLKVRLEDRYDNPISNATITFEIRPPATSLPASPLPQGLTNLRLYWTGACSNPFAAQDCALISSSTGTTTQYFGTQIETLLGNTYNTKYTVRVAADLAGVALVDFTLETIGNRGSDTSHYFSPYLMLSVLQPVNDKGQLVNAAKIATELKAPLASSLYLNEDEIDLNATLGSPASDCILGSEQTLCRAVKSTGIVRTRPITNAAVTYTPSVDAGSIISVQNFPEGKYRARYRANASPKKDVIEAWGEATLELPEIYVDSADQAYIRAGQTIPMQTVTARTGQYAAFRSATLAPLFGPDKPFYTASYTVYGLDASLTIEPGVILLNDVGQTSVDVMFNYTIQPPEYTANDAVIDLWKSDPSGGESWDGYLIGDEIQGTGSTGLIRGTEFDVSRLYHAQIVLNYGADMEVRSGKKILPVAQVAVKDDNNVLVDEIKFCDGSKPNKRNKIELKSAAFSGSCGSLAGTIRTALSSGQTATTPGTAYYPAQYGLTFSNIGNGCSVKINGKDKFILSNRSTADLQQQNTVPSDTTVLYGGIGNNLQLMINETTKDIPIEPVGVIVLGIDGLRQDVLYAQNEQQVDLTGTQSPYYIQPSELKGLCSILGGKYSSGWFSSSCDPAGWEEKHIKLLNVTAVFPSITLASWASIFSGKMPNETGILGNEFFARDLNKQIPLKFGNPAGMITFDSGAFKGYDDYNLWNLLFANKDDKAYFFVPYQSNWKNRVDVDGTPQNDRQIYKPDTVFETISYMPAATGYFTPKGGDPVVVSYSHYARGAYWLTWDVEMSWNSSRTLDKASWGKFEDYLGDGVFAGKYDKFDENGTLVRNTVPFSALTVWYLPGLDHEAHLKGMGIYRDYFKDVTDDYVKKLVERLKNLDEFDNKIFIIVADHGHTAMPTDLKYLSKEKLPPNDDVSSILTDAEMECKLKLNFADSTADNADNTYDGYNAREAERANNNLHIWELAEVIRTIGKSGGTQYKVLAPAAISNLYTATTSTGLQYELTYGATADINKANVIAALNGPMAHIYLKGPGGWENENPDIGQLTILTKYLKRYFQEGGVNIDDKEIKKNLKNLLSSVDRLLIRVGGVYKDFKGVEADANGNVIGPLANTISETYFDTNKYVSAFTKITGMNHLKRSGDIVLIMKDEVDIPISEIANNRFTTGVACKSWHGSLNRSDSYVPLIVAYPGGNKFEMQSVIDNTQGCSTTSGCDGNWRVTDLIKTVVQKQYGSQ